MMNSKARLLAALAAGTLMSSASATATSSEPQDAIQPELPTSAKPAKPKRPTKAEKKQHKRARQAAALGRK